MSRLLAQKSSDALNIVDSLYSEMAARLAITPPDACPVDMACAFLKTCHAQTCGKCAPCRIGIGAVTKMLESVLDGTANSETLKKIEETAAAIADTSDCAIGKTAGEHVLKSLKVFRDDYESHINNNICADTSREPVPCVSRCPANVDVPGYIRLVENGRCADAVRLIRKDNPFPVACAYICEHPCEKKCRRGMLDDVINIRALKKYAVDTAGVVPVPECAPETGKKVAIIGGGPSGLTAAYFLKLMGHSVTLFERRKKLGGMLRYGIPSYRFPREKLDEDINAILSAGIEVKTGFDIGKDMSFKELREKFDCVYIAIGAQGDKKTGIEGEDSRGVISAVEMLGSIGDEVYPDFRGKKVAIIGGGNVAMDVTRTSVRLGAEKVTCVYRRRQQDMTALPEEIEGALAEGAELLTLQAPVRIESDASGNAVALWAKPQNVGEYDRAGRPRPVPADKPEIRIPADIIVLAIGQSVESKQFEEAGAELKWGNIVADSEGKVPNLPGVFTGGDCETGPLTAIRAIAAGKLAAANIDAYLGFNHEISVDVEIPAPNFCDKPKHGRNNITEREASERKNEFEAIECEMTCEAACKEAGRCLNCDKFGYGALKGGRIAKW